MAIAALLYAIVGTFLANLVGRRLISLNFMKQRYEANFRFGLVRVRENAEGIALYNGERRAKEGRKRGEDEIRFVPEVGLFGGDAATVGGENEGGTGTGRIIVTVVKLGDGERRERLKGEFNLRGDLSRGRLGGDRDGAGEEELVGQETDLGRRGAGAEKVEGRIAHRKKGWRK